MRDQKVVHARHFLFRFAGCWNAGGSNAGARVAAPALGLGCLALYPASHRRRGGGSARGLFSQGWPSLFDKLIARRGLADPGVTLVTTKVELEEIRLKDRRKKKLKGELAGDWRQRPRGDARSSAPGSDSPPPSSSFANAPGFCSKPPPGPRPSYGSRDRRDGRSAAS